MNEESPILTTLAENDPGVTARVTGLFAGRGYNIETICGAPTANPEMSRITITTRANPHMFEQIMKNLRRLINVLKLRDMTGIRPRIPDRVPKQFGSCPRKRYRVPRQNAPKGSCPGKSAGRLRRSAETTPVTASVVFLGISTSFIVSSRFLVRKPG